MLSADMLSANNGMLSAKEKRSGVSKWSAKFERTKHRRRSQVKALTSKGGGTRFVSHSLSLPVRILLNRRAPWSRCVHGFNSASPASVRARGMQSTLLIALSDKLVSRRYISKLDEVTQIAGRRLVP